MKKNAKVPKRNPAESQEFGVAFSLDDLDVGDRFPQLMSYENELETAAKKAAYFEMLANNAGKPDALKVARDCKKRAAALRKKSTGMDDKSALQLNQRAKALEEYAEYLSDIVPEEVLAVQREHDHPGTQSEAVDTQQWLSKFLPKTDAQKANFWRTVHDWDKIQKTLYYFAQPESVNRNEVLFIRAQKDPFAVKLLAHQARTQISCLLELAEIGNPDAARAAAAAVKDMVASLNSYARANLNVFRSVAKMGTQWPVLYSLQSKYRENANAICSELQLGEDYLLNVDPMAKWNPDELGSKVAVLLFKYIEAVRARPDNYKNFSFCKAATELPPSKHDGAGHKWWQVAEKVLLDAIPDPAADERLLPLAKGDATRKYKSRMRQRILARLQKRFLQLFYKENR